MNDEAIPTKTSDPNYDNITVRSCDEDVDTYDRLQHSQQQTNTIRTPLEAEADKCEDDFYNASKHTYTEINIEQKTKGKDKKSGKEDSPVYEEALPGELSWGPQSEGYSKLQTK